MSNIIGLDEEQIKKPSFTEKLSMCKRLLSCGGYHKDTKIEQLREE